VTAHRIWLGRSHEIAELEGGLDGLPSGSGSLYLLTGEPGIGKSRLADEIGRIAAARGIPVHWGRAWEAGGAPAYWPWIQVTRAIARDVEPFAGPTPERFQLFDAVAALLRARAPRVLVLDDLHAADPSSLELMHFLVRDLREVPLMIIGTYRDAEARLSADHASLLARIGREGTVLPLRRLGRDDVAAFVALATGRDADPERIDTIYAQTEGNPLFLRELLRLHGPSARVTDGIREVVRARLALLDRDTRALLEAAAVLGREFEAGPLAAVAGVSDVDVRTLVEPAANAEIVEPLDHPPRWRFTHVLLRQGLYDDIADARRRTLHAAAAGVRSAGLAEIAHHLERAVPHVPPRRAAEAALRAGDHALELLAFEDAREHYAVAERLDDDPRGQFEAIYGRAHVYMRMAEVRLALAECERAATLARRLDDGALLARAVLLSTYELVPDVRDAQLIAALEEALARLPPGDGALRARCLAQLAAQRHPEPDNAPRLALAREAIAMARRLDDIETLRLTLSGASIAMTIYGPVDEVRAIHDELLRLALAAGDKRVAMRTHMFLVGTSWQRGDLADARVHGDAVRALIEEFGHNRFAWITWTLGSVAAMTQGQFDEAARLLELAEVAAREDQARGALFAAWPLAFACVTERYDDRNAIETRVRARFEALPHELGRYLGEMLVAQLHGRAGDRGRATAQLAALARHPCFAAIAEPAWLALLVEACCLVGDRALAERLYTRIAPRAEQFASLGPLTASVEPPYSRQLGLLAHALGRIDDAVAHLEHALARTREAGMRGHFARLGLELARVLAERDRTGDRARATALDAEARGIATELGQRGLLAQLGEPPPAPRVAVATAFEIRRDGDVWFVAHAERSTRLRDSRGMQLLAQLVASPGHELHVLQLAAPGDAPIDVGDAGPGLDGRAISAYRQRLLDLREELADAERATDVGRAERASAEIDALTDELASAVGLGGRDRRAASAAERARTAVQKRLRDAIRKIGEALPELGVHLEQTIYTGTFCGYLPNGRGG
jgi:tetratricopeptide (TPR) repeat protein